MVRNNNHREIITYVDDQTSPYFLPQSDNPRVILVTQQLTGTNYNNWHRSMITALLAKNKLAFVDGSLPRPDPTDLLFSQWVRCNIMVVSWLRNSVVPAISSSLMYLDDASLIWNDLREQFSQGNLARIYQLRQQLLNLTQGSDDVSTYYTNLRVIWDEFRDFQPSSWCTCGGCHCNSAKNWNEYQAHDCAMQFLVGLNPSYAQLRSNILSVTSLPSLSKIFALVMQEERQRSIDTGFISPIGNPSPAPMVSEQRGSQINAAKYGRGHDNEVVCSHCGKPNHTVDKCFQIIGFPPGYGRGRGKSSSKAHSRAPANFRSINQVGNNLQIAKAGSTSATSPNLSPDNIAQLLSYLQNQMQMNANSTPPSPGAASSSGSTNASTTAAPPFSGSFTGDSDWEG